MKKLKLLWRTILWKVDAYHNELERLRKENKNLREIGLQLNDAYWQKYSRCQELVNAHAKLGFSVGADGHIIRLDQAREQA